jgi:hypothetical protein
MGAAVLCFRPEPMRIPIKPLFALVLAVILPMRGFASAAHCEPLGQGHGAHSHGVPSALRTDAARGDLSLHAAEEGHCAGGKSSPHAHACTDCCCGAAAVLTAPRFSVPKAAAALIARRLAWPHPALAIDRLDRPPRQPA